jgi:hypothetical protein
MRRANGTSRAWKILGSLRPDVAILQGVAGIPTDVKRLFDIKFQTAIASLNPVDPAILLNGSPAVSDSTG